MSYWKKKKELLEREREDLKEKIRRYENAMSNIAKLEYELEKVEGIKRNRIEKEIWEEASFYDRHAESEYGGWKDRLREVSEKIRLAGNECVKENAAERAKRRGFSWCI